MDASQKTLGAGYVEAKRLPTSNIDSMMSTLSSPPSQSLFEPLLSSNASSAPPVSSRKICSHLQYPLRRDLSSVVSTTISCTIHGIFYRLFFTKRNDAVATLCSIYKELCDFLKLCEPLLSDGSSSGRKSLAHALHLCTTATNCHPFSLVHPPLILLSHSFFQTYHIVQRRAIAIYRLS